MTNLSVGAHRQGVINGFADTEGPPLNTTANPYPDETMNQCYQDGYALGRQLAGEQSRKEKTTTPAPVSLDAGVEAHRQGINDGFANTSRGLPLTPSRYSDEAMNLLYRDGYALGRRLAEEKSTLCVQDFLARASTAYGKVASHAQEGPQEAAGAPISPEASAGPFEDTSRAPGRGQEDKQALFMSGLELVAALEGLERVIRANPPADVANPCLRYEQYARWNELKAEVDRRLALHDSRAEQSKTAIAMCIAMTIRSIWEAHGGKPLTAGQLSELMQTIHRFLVSLNQEI